MTGTTVFYSTSNSLRRSRNPTAVEFTPALRYLLGRLKTLCEEAIRKSITVESVCTIFLLAHKHNAEGLKVR